MLVLSGAALLYLGWQVVSIHAYGFRDDGRSADCAIVLGSAAWHHKPSPVLRERLNHAIKLYEEGRVKALVLTGGFGNNAPMAESQVAESYCIDRGIPREVLHLEVESQTTVGNLAEARKLLEEHGLRTALVVSDPWHLKRGVLIARRHGIDAYQSGTTTTRFRSFKARISFLLREMYLYHVFLLFGK
ncbi:MAG: YdcF family protein [Akkermansiaceae bacterium]|nr:YdcF family protein [Akkermansiaceae bacterium]